jgi:hypothetical protein
MSLLSYWQMRMKMTAILIPIDPSIRLVDSIRLAVTARFEGVVTDLASFSRLLAQGLRVVSSPPSRVSDGFWRSTLG